MPRRQVTSRSREYWRLRELQAQKKYISEETEYTKALADIYKDMEDSVQKEIDAFYGRYADQEGISIAEAKKRADKLDIEAYGRKAEQYVKTKDLSPKANEEMKLYNLTMKANRLEVLKANIQLELTRCHEALGQQMTKALTERTYEEMNRQAGILGQTVPDAETAANSIVNASFKGATFSTRIWKSQDLLRAELNKQLQIGMIQGRNPVVLARAIRDRFGVSRRNAERLMRTELCRVQIEAQRISYENIGYDEYEFIAIGSACEICRMMDGKTFKVADMLPAENAPPMHPNCRCSTAAYMEKPGSYQENGNKSVELPEELRTTQKIDKSIKNGIRDAIEDIEKNCGYKIPEMEYAPYAENKKAPFTFIPYEKNGMYRAKLNINTLFDWNETLESLNERIYNKNYKEGILASKNINDLIFHEVAHFKTFESCETWEEFIRKEQEVRNRYIPGISRYNTISHDGAETIAEGVVAEKNKEAVSQEVKALIQEYIKW